MFGDDDEILQDFLVEAGEILEQLSEQLVELEQRPDDKDLLNAIFRGFHTVKGGAGFLQLNAMVDCCHVTENLFDILRTGKRQVTAELMDVVLQALDTVNSQFRDIQAGQEPTAAEPALIEMLGRLVAGEDLVAATGEAPATDTGADSSGDDVLFGDDDLFDMGGDTDTASNTASTNSAETHDDITDQEFESLLDAISDSSDNSHDAGSSGSVSDSSEISEDEFEALLDQLHGKGKGPGAGAAKPAASEPASAPPPAAVTPQPSPAPIASGNDEIISEDEFEALLDQLHGVGKGPGKAEADSEPVKPAAAQPGAASPAAAGGEDLISEDEFESLLDQLHGKGKAPGVAGGTPVATVASSNSKPVPAAANKPAAKPQLKAVADGGDGGSKPPAAGLSAKDVNPPAEATVRVDTQRLDDIMNMVGELVLVRNRLVRLGDERSDETLSKAVSNLDVVTADLQSAVMKTRMQPIKKVFGRFPRVVRDLARSLKKEINLELVGEETDLDKNLVEALADPLVHLVRNSVDHGIELPDAREAKGKPRVGKVVLAAQQEGDHILLSITDDGGGMDANKLRAIAVEKGVLDEDAAGRLSDQEAFALIFAPGFSTKKEISDVSGRGVGMDVVKTKITQLNGTIEIHSQLNEGTRFDIKVPLTLAIMPTLMIMLADQTFALPLVNVDEIFHMDLTKTNVVDGQECITIREKAIPIFHLKQWLVPKCPYQPPQQGHVVIVSVGTQRVGFVVDQLIGQEEVVIKPLGKMLHGTPGMAGATITGDGTIALILDVPSMLKRYAGNAA
ncbi:chemotaxis protein CheA [Halioxenophilus sp. WMMB6]|uniref:chemotaxis protein CheA n=1 Tax=Halioxenophilus sp. WMMB6 TaxID=3073815 RepID=UPI00295E2AD2|nr:chemotaxis protein CheA [Halioxenophilus sp. WMMB6]